MYSLATANYSFGKEIKNEVDLESINSSIKAVINNTSIPFSGSVILLKQGKPILELQKGNGINAESKFVIASLSKQITATLILQAVDNGKIDLSDSLNHYLYKSSSPSEKKYDDSITIHHLLTHTSGVQPLGKPNLFAPGTQFKYSNLGYSLLGNVLEQVNSQPFDKQLSAFSAKNKLDGIHASVGSIKNIQQTVSELATGLNEINKLTPSNLIINASQLPSGGLIASTSAFASFQHLLHSRKLISPESYQLMTQPHTKIKFLWPNMSYGYGLRINKDNNLTEYSHTGYVSGYMSMSLHYPEHEIDLVMLENLALNLNDLDRVFEIHNQIRQTIQRHLKVISSK
ncbi:class A beta-lactamase-related serine hydrolase [Parashewanella curva]|uniref:Class A beta-lactamase-related serine hydrolase n=2 Tax=Parashewanella curva TaxID=2338552 RepID=A0A3L8PTW9_9GAMM|nr:class A beta-lactamase-related serine hydrolase [Parashewanella curva]